MSIRPSDFMEQLGSHQKDFHEMWYLSIFRKAVAKIQVLLKSDKNEGYFTSKTKTRILSHLAEFFLEPETFRGKV
jgi:hypothetical protein